MSANRLAASKIGQYSDIRTTSFSFLNNYLILYYICLATFLGDYCKKYESKTYLNVRVQLR